VLNHAKRGKRYIVLFQFLCDESYDSLPDGAMRPKGQAFGFEPKSYVVAGFFSDDKTWGVVKKEWMVINRHFGVQQFHASHLNGRRCEFEGWEREKQIGYSKSLLKIIGDQGKRMHVVSCGILADEYRSIVNEEGRKKLGHPYLACFKTCVALIAKEMDGFPPGDRFAVVVDQNQFDMQAVKAFYDMKDDVNFKYRSRLARCTPGSMQEIIPLQTADLVAYEVFKRLHDRSTKESEMRKVLARLLKENGVSERIFGIQSLKNLKHQIESIVCSPDRLVIIPS